MEVDYQQSPPSFQQGHSSLHSGLHQIDPVFVQVCFITKF